MRVELLAMVKSIYSTRKKKQYFTLPVYAGGLIIPFHRSNIIRDLNPVLKYVQRIRR